MPENIIVDGSVGIPIRVDCGRVITDATTYELILINSSGVESAWVCTKYDATTLEHVLAEDEISVGTYTLQPHVVIDGVDTYGYPPVILECKAQGVT